MKILYVAVDGHQFAKKEDCLDHEWYLSHKDKLRYIHFWDIRGNKLYNILDESTYLKVHTIFLQSSEDIETLQELAHYKEFRDYYHINKPGMWVWNDRQDAFVFVDTD